MLKYGRTNWRPCGVRASIYFDAFRRHTDAWFEGEEQDPDDGVDHLGAALACLAILVDARAAGSLTDDRMVKGGYRGQMDRLKGEVKRLKELHKDKKPYKHYTIDHTAGVPEAAVQPAWDWTPVTPGSCVAHPKDRNRPVKVKRRDAQIVTPRRYCFWSWGKLPSNPHAEIIAWKYA